MPERQVEGTQPPADQLPDGAVTQRLHGRFGGNKDLTKRTRRPSLLQIPQDSFTDSQRERIYLRVRLLFGTGNGDALVFPIESFQPQPANLAGAQAINGQ